jgi:TolA-binding protein
MVKHKLGAQLATAVFLLFLSSSAPGQCDESKPANGSSTAPSKNAGFTNTTGSTSTIDRTSTTGSTTTFDRTTTNGSTTTSGFTTATGATRTTGATSTTGATTTTGVTGATGITGLRDSSGASPVKPVVKDWSNGAPSTAASDSKESSATKETIAPETEPKPSGASALPDHITPSWVPLKIVEEKPKDKPAPPGQDAAVKLYTARKFAPAAAQFEKFIKDGTANPETHAYLAYCYYSLKHYTKALQQFNWVEKNTPNNYKLRTSAERSGAMLRTQMSGICPQSCLKPNDPRWHSGDGGHRWITWRTSNGSVSVSDNHIGQLLSVKNDQIVNQGVCPTCGGTGRVPALHDGDPIPR